MGVSYWSLSSEAFTGGNLSESITIFELYRMVQKSEHTSTDNTYEYIFPYYFNLII
jgi:hypothetical protein